MAIKSKEEIASRGLEIDLTGPKGNAFFLMGTAKKLARSLEKDGDAIIKKMMSGNYENLLAVFEEEFGDFVTLYR